MSESPKKRNILATAVLSLLIPALGGTIESCDGKDGRKDAIVLKVRGLLKDWYNKSIIVDLADGQDNFDEEAIKNSLLKYLGELELKDPDIYQKLVLQLEAALSHRKPLEDDKSIALDNELLKPENLKRILENRNRSVKADGTVDFKTPEDEAGLSLADLTLDFEIKFEAKNPLTLERIGITADKPFTVYRVTEETEVSYKGKKIKVPAGTFVVETEEGSLHRVAVFNGDIIADSLNRDFAEEIDKRDAPEAPSAFEQLLASHLPGFSIDRGRKIYNENFKTYDRLMKTEYKELLTKSGISLQEGFAYYLMWCEANNVPVSESSMRQYIENRLKKEDEKIEEGKREKRTEESRESGEKEIDNGGEAEDNYLTYEDERARASYGESPSYDQEKVDVMVIKKYGPLFAIIRLGGRFFDHYTYNRLTGNYSSAVSSAIYDKKEYLRVSDLSFGLGPKSPGDILRKAKNHQSNFAERLNKTTTFNRNSDEDLRKALAKSEELVTGNKFNPEDFQIGYNQDGSVERVTLNGKNYEPRTFLASPKKLKQLPDDTAEIRIGNLRHDFNIQQYFDQYHALEAKRQGVPQNVEYYDVEENRINNMRNMMWFVESAVSFYEPIAEEIAKGAGSPAAKVLVIAKWLQVNLEYIDEISEINKITLGTLIDMGGDCEDSFIALKTLAGSIGLGHMVGAVIFDGHIAPVIKGNHGRVTYQIDGETWTIVETATSQGRVIKPGETKHKDPKVFMLDEKRIMSASDRYVILETVALSELDSDLVDDFNDKVKTVDGFLSSVEIDKKGNPQNFDKDKLNKIFKALKGSFIGIIKTGKIAKELSDRYNSLVGKLEAIMQKSRNIKQDLENEKRREFLRGHPALVQKKIEQYLKLAENVGTKLENLDKKSAKLFKPYVGREQNFAAMDELGDKFTSLVNKFGVVIDFDKMKEIHYKVIVPLNDPELTAFSEKLLQATVDPLNSIVYDRLNNINAILRDLQQ